jgi:hypothetical protein
MAEYKCGRVPWLLRVVWNPVAAFDLTDGRQRTDHSKVVPWAFLVTACVFKGFGNPFEWYELLALGSMSFGYGAWRTFLKSKSITGTFEKKESLVKTVIRQERDVAEGIDPA